MTAPAPDTSDWLSVTEAARAYAVNPRTIRRRIARQELRAVQIVGEHGPEYRVEPPPPGYTRPVPEDAGQDSPGQQDQTAALVPVVQQYMAAIVAERDELRDELRAVQEARLADRETIGRLTERLDQLQARLDAAPPPDAPAARRWRWPWEPR